jgi:hypothetical protein
MKCLIGTKYTNAGEKYMKEGVLLIRAMEVPNYKHQIPNKLQITSTKFQTNYNKQIPKSKQITINKLQNPKRYFNI